MKIVSNTTPLIGLATIGRFEILRQLFGEINIPKAVYDEAVTAGREEGGAKREVSAATWIKTVEIQDRLAVDVLLDELDLGEAEAIVLAREFSADWVLGGPPVGCCWQKIIAECATFAEFCDITCFSQRSRRTLR